MFDKIANFGSLLYRNVYSACFLLFRVINYSLLL
jgi:hypothetical protein